MLIRTFLLLFLFSLFACKPKQDISVIAHPVHVDGFMKKKLESELLEMRKQKDQYFKTSPDSPLPGHLKQVFTSLEYYAPDWKYRFEGRVIRHPNPTKFQMITTSGVWRDAVKYGYIRFQLEGKDFRLEVYRLLDLAEKNLLFVPFVDINVGKETYPAGRYIDLQEKPDGRYVIDFNTAYNPSCAYGGDFPCPVTPKENHLPIAIPAGEKILSLAAALEKSRRVL
ncbi:DUF1684 domain-containing protein [bacterium]|nr:DUF1684 domain-containing protein [bacterium]MCI0605464.1 DUF1684 domain-containing protein [bacterium]